MLLSALLALLSFLSNHISAREVLRGKEKKEKVAATGVVKIGYFYSDALTVASGLGTSFCRN